MSRVSMNKQCGKDSCKQRVSDRLCAHHCHNVLAGGYRGFVFFRTATILEPHSKKLNSALRAPCGERNGSVLDYARKGAAVMILVACNPVKKHGPWVVARLRVVAPSGDPV
jgi:hypothetical protein